MASVPLEASRGSAQAVLGSVLVIVLLLGSAAVGLRSSSGPSAAPPAAGGSLVETAVQSLEAGNTPIGSIAHACLNVEGGLRGCAHATPVLAPTTAAAAGAKLAPPIGDSTMTMTYDESDGYVLLYVPEIGGKYIAETWEFQGTNWTQLHPAAQPSARWPAVMIYDPAIKRVVFFGGCCNPWPPSNDTWTFHKGNWTLLHPAVSPPGRYAAMASYDSVDRCVLMFGGEGAVGPQTAGPLGDTWEFNASGWRQIPGNAHPAPRENGGMANDIPDQYVVLYGGQDGAVNAHLFNDTWTFKSGTWTHLTGSGAPHAFQSLTMQMDRADRYVLLFGGASLTTGLPSNETWKFSAGGWSLLHPTAGRAPSPRYYPGLSFDARTSEIILFGGGNGGSLYNDTWSYSAGTWTLIP